MATPNVVPRADQEGGLGTAAKSWGKLFIENPTAGGTAAATISNLDVDEIALDINVNNTTGNIIDISASALTTGKAFYADINDSLTSTATGIISHIDYTKTGVTGSGNTRTVTGVSTVILDTATNHASGNVHFTGHAITLLNTSAQGTIKHTGLKISCTGGDITGTPSSSHGIIITTEDGGVDIATRSSADAGDTFTLATSATGVTTMTTIDDGGNAADLNFVVDGKMVITPADMTGVVFHLDANADTDNIVDIDAGVLDVDTDSITVDATDNITITAADDATLSTSSADGLLTISSAHTAGQAIHIDGDANVGSIVDIDAGILDIDVAATATIDAATSLTITTPALTLSGASTVFSSSLTEEPVVEIRNEHNGGTAGKLLFNNTEAGTAGADSDFLGTIEFQGHDGGTADTTYATINSRIQESDAGAEAGRLNFNVATNNGTVVEALNIKGTTSSVQPTMEINADVDVDGTFTMDGAGFSLDSSGTASNITVASDGAADDLTISLTGATDSSIFITSSGTGTDALSIDATAGGFLLAPNLADGQTAQFGPTDSTYLRFRPNNTASAETIVLKNSSGTSSAAIDIEATAGSIDIDAGDNITIDAADSITIATADTGADGKITIASAATGSVTGFHLDVNADSDVITHIDAGKLDIDASGVIDIDVASDITIDSGNDLTISVINDTTIATRDVLTLQTSSTDGHIHMQSAHTTGQAIHIDGDADAGSIVDIDAGSLDIDALDNITIDAADAITITTGDTGADGRISLISGVATAATAIHLDGNANAASVVDIDAGILDIDVTGKTFITSGDDIIFEASGSSVQLANLSHTQATTVSLGRGRHTIVAELQVIDANETDQGVIMQLPGVKIPQYAHIREVTLAVRELSNLGTYNIELGIGTNDGVSAGTVPANYHQLLGADTNFSYSTDSPTGPNSDIDIGSGTGSLKKVWWNNRTSGLGFGGGELTDDHYVYICSAGTSNGTTDGANGIVCVTIEYYGID